MAARDSAVGARDEYVRRARQDGLSWQAVGEALGLDQGEDRSAGYDLGVAAYKVIVGEPDIWWQPSFGWDCPSCGQAVSDRGPYELHPEDNEHGHAESCEQLAADVAAHRRRTADWDTEVEAR